MNAEDALSLYRMGYIQVVIATGTHGHIQLLQLVAYTFPLSGTLALGINAPTRTSVFYGDSPYLTALMVSVSVKSTSA